MVDNMFSYNNFGISFKVIILVPSVLLEKKVSIIWHFPIYLPWHFQKGSVTLQVHLFLSDGAREILDYHLES